MDYSKVTLEDALMCLSLGMSENELLGALWDSGNKNVYYDIYNMDLTFPK